LRIDRHGARGLAVTKLRLALLDERAHAFLLIVERERRMELAALERETVG
jgi:hypothetical protein